MSDTEARPGHVVNRGETLWRIATEELGNGRRWPEIFELNRDQLARPEELRPGMVLRLPDGLNPMPPPPPKPLPPDHSSDIATGLSIPAAGENPDRNTVGKLLDRAADHHGVPRAILKAVALRESSWRQFDASGSPLAGRNPSTTDWGVMQINDYWHPHAFPRAKTDIAFNITYGASYLARQFKRYGNWPHAVASYNAGSVKVRPDGTLSNQRYVDFVLAHAHSEWGWAPLLGGPSPAG